MAQEKRVGGLKKVGLLLGVCAALLLGAMGQTSYAYSINQYPDIVIADVGDAGSFNISNAGSTLSLVNTAFATNIYRFSGDPGSFLGSFFDLYAISNGSTTGNNLQLGSNFLLYDNKDTNNTYDLGVDTLRLSGQLTSLTIEGTDIYKFLFSTTGGDLGPEYGDKGYIELNLGIGSGDINSISTPVPEPSTVVLLLLGVGGICLFRRRKLLA